jgi:membrane dipeptidase
MIFDLHAHYPMHLMDKLRTLTNATTPIAVKKDFRTKPLNLLQRIIMFLANNIFNFPALCDPAVTIENLRNGNVMVALSVLYAPFDEIDFSKPYGSPPSASYFTDLMDQISAVESDVENNYSQTAKVAHSLAELDQAAQKGKVALIHAVEGGFHVGDTDYEVIENVETLAKRGVGYITVAHLFFRQVATDAPALPFLPDVVYDFIFPQKQGLGLTPRGRTLIQAMVENGILIDITHMSEKSIDDTFDLLSKVFHNQTIPVMATHSACRFDGLKFKYNMTDRHIKSVADGGGVIGLISCKHYMSEGMAKPKTFEDSMKILIEHIDHIHYVTNSYDHIALGSDLDGFIKPTLPYFDTPVSFAKIEERLIDTYGCDVAESICSGNAMRVLSQVWQKPIKPVTRKL